MEESNSGLDQKQIYASAMSLSSFRTLN